MAITLPHSAITEIPNTEPAATPALWNTRYNEIDDNFERLATYTPVGTSSTAAGTKAKAVTINGFSLSTNAFVLVKFSNANTASAPTLNVSNTGAKAIYFNGAAVPTGYLEANKFYHFVYDGSHWVLTGDVDVRHLYLPLAGGTITGNLAVQGTTTLTGLLTANGGVTTKVLSATDVTASGTLKVTGATTLTGALAANGGTTTTTLKATGTSTLAAVNATNISASGTLKVTGATTLTGALAANGGLTTTTIKATGTSTLAAVNATNISASGTLSVTGTSTLTGKLTANGGVTTKALTATSLDLNGNGDVSGTWKVTGATTLTGLLTANGGVTTKKVTATELDLNGNGDVSGNLNVGGLLQVTGSAQLNGGGTVKTPTSNVNDTSIINANWAWNLMRSYGLGAGLGTAPSYTGALNDLDTTGFYTLSGTYADGPAGMQTITGQILHMQRRFAAGTVAFQLLPYSNTIRFRTKNQDTWGGWNTAATQEWTQEQISGLTTLTDDGVRVISPADYNTLTSPGFYHCNQTNQANGPGKANKLIVLAQPGDTPKHITQLTLPISNTEKLCPAVRYMDAKGNWSDWFKLALVDSNETLRASSLWLTVSSMIKYPGASSNSIPNFGFEVEDYVKGDDLSKAINARYLVYAKDQSGVAVGALGGMIVGVEQTKKTWARLYAYKNQNGVATADYIGILANPDGTYETRSPHPVTESNDNSIATTAWSVGKTGNRGNLSGFETPVVQSSALTVTNTSRDTNLVTGAVKITVNNGAANQAWTKTVAISNGSATIALGSKWKWYGGAAPDVSANCVLVLHWCSTFGVASLIVTA